MQLLQLLSPMHGCRLVVALRPLATLQWAPGASPMKDPTVVSQEHSACSIAACLCLLPALRLLCPKWPALVHFHIMPLPLLLQVFLLGQAACLLLDAFFPGTQVMTWFGGPG